MITLFTFWCACEYKKSPEELYIGTVLIDLSGIIGAAIIASQYMSLM